MNKRKRTLLSIFILFSMCILGLILIQRMKRPTSLSSPLTQSQAVEPTPYVPTNTFLDVIFSTVLFYRQDTLVALTLPTREEREIVGVGNTASVPLDSTMPALWSADGSLIGVLTKERNFVLSTYDTGAFKASFQLSQSLNPSQISLDSASEILAVGESDPKSAEPMVRFYSVVSQKEIGNYPRCSGDGVWLTGVGFVTKCIVADTSTLELIRFEPNSSLMTPLSRESKTLSYTLIDEYRPGLIFAKRIRNGQTDLVTIDGNGTVTPIPVSEYKSVPDIQNIVDAKHALMTRIEQTEKMGSVKDVSVAKDNSFLIFQTAEGLYAAKLDLKEKPFFLGKGTLPRIRPE